MIALGVVVVFSVFSSYSPGPASASGSYGIACYVVTGASSGGTSTLHCNVTAPSSPVGSYYFAMAHMSISGTGCSYSNCGFVSVTPGTVFTLSIPGGDTSVHPVVFNDNANRSSVSDLFNNCSVCTEADLDGAGGTGSTVMSDVTASDTIVGAADHAPLAAEQTPPDTESACSEEGCASDAAIVNGLPDATLANWARTGGQYPAQWLGSGTTPIPAGDPSLLPLTDMTEFEAAAVAAGTTEGTPLCGPVCAGALVALYAGGIQIGLAIGPTFYTWSDPTGAFEGGSDGPCGDGSSCKFEVVNAGETFDIGYDSLAHPIAVTLPSAGEVLMGNRAGCGYGNEIGGSCINIPDANLHAYSAVQGSTHEAQLNALGTTYPGIEYCFSGTTATEDGVTGPACIWYIQKVVPFSTTAPYTTQPSFGDPAPGWTNPGTRTDAQLATRLRNILNDGNHAAAREPVTDVGTDGVGDGDGPPPASSSGGGSGGGGGGGACDVANPAVNFVPLTASGITTKFPFGLFTWVYDGVSGVTSSGSAPSPTVPLIGGDHFGHSSFSLPLSEISGFMTIFRSCVLLLCTFGFFYWLASGFLGLTDDGEQGIM